MKKYLAIGFASLLVLVGVVYINTGTVLGMTAFNFVNKATGYTENYNFFVATTTTATSTNNTIGDGAFKIAGAKRVAVLVSRGGVVEPNTGSTLFKIEVSPDGVNYYPYNTLLQNLGTSTDRTAVSSLSVGAATTTVIGYMEYLGWYSMRCIAIETTDGEHTCKALAEF